MNQVYDSKTHCCGCTACEYTCPKAAISMKEDEKGFSFPVIDHEKCVDCKKCVNVCPMQHPREKEDVKISCKAMRLLEKEKLKKSSSGGVAYGLSRYILEHGGIVYGAAYSDQLSVKHIRIDDIKDLPRLQGSKYVASNLTGIFPLVKRDLMDRRKVLFIGLGCQIAGLNAFLGKKYDLLITIDLICHGVPSPKIWRKYIEESITRHLPCNVNMRDKMKGWANPTWTISKGGRVIKKQKIIQNDYLRLFLNNYGLRESCFNCSFKSMQHEADLTLGDCWSMEHLIQNMNDDGMGMSMVFENSSKGSILLEKCRNLFWVQDLEVDKAVAMNLMLIRSVKVPKDENQFWLKVWDQKLHKSAYTFIPDDSLILKFKKLLYPIKQKLTGA